MPSRVSLRVLAAVAAGFAAGLAGSGSVLAASPPAQPKTGPGAVLLPDAEVVKRAVGRASAHTYVFHTAGAPAEPRPVVVLLHAWGAINPQIYGAWIDHLARRGHLVLYPAFQELRVSRPRDATATAATLVKDALATLAADEAARPDLSRVAYLGHSAGAGISVNLAAIAKARDLPVPKLIFAVMAGGIASDAKARGVPLENLGEIDPSTSIVTMIGDREFQAADRASRRILREATGVPVAKKLFMRAGSDDHGFPTLSATLASPAGAKTGYDAAAITVPPNPPPDPKAPRPQPPRFTPDMVLTGEQTILLGQLQRNVTDALDYLAYWRIFDAAAAAAFGKTDMATLRVDPTFLDMGRWSDGWPVRRLSAETPKPVDPTATATTTPAPDVKPAPTPAKPAPSPRRDTRSTR